MAQKKKQAINSLLADTEELLAKYRLKKQVEEKAKRVCKNHPDRKVYYKDLCKEDYEELQAKNLEAKKNKEPWISTNDLYYIYNDEGKPQLYHRYLVEKTLGRRLSRDEKVSFLDGNKHNCVIENLTLESNKINLKDLLCSNCRGSLTSDQVLPKFETLEVPDLSRLQG